MQGTMQGKYNWSALDGITENFLPDGMKISGQQESNITFSADYPVSDPNAIWDNLNSTASIGFTEAHYMGLDFGPTRVNLTVDQGILKIAPFSTRVNQGQFKFNGRADFKQHPAVLRTTGQFALAKGIRVNKENVRTLLTYVNPIFANAVNARGLINFNCKELAIPLKENAVDQLKIAGTLSISQLHLDASDLLGQLISALGRKYRGQALTIHPTEFTLDKGILSYDNMQVDIGDNPVNFSGRIGLDKKLNMTVTLPYTLAGRTINIHRKSRGSRISLPLKGTVDRPKLDLRSMLKDQLQKGLMDLFR
jgi:hypothetical protein